MRVMPRDTAIVRDMVQTVSLEVEYRGICHRAAKVVIAV
jgi:hypothetical protein